MHISEGDFDQEYYSTLPLVVTIEALVAEALRGSFREAVREVDTLTESKRC